MAYVDRSDEAKKAFRKALRAHVTAVHRALDTENELFAAEKLLYDAGINIAAQYREFNIDRPEDWRMPRNLRPRE